MAKKTAKKQEEPKEPLFDFNSYHFDIQHKFKLTKKQIEVLKVAQKPETKMIILDGYPGTAKSFTSVLVALEKLRDKKVRGITAFRSTVQNQIGATGWLSGGLDEKMQYFAAPFYAKMGELLKDADREKISTKLFDFLPTSFVRSISLADECIILSEAQNCDRSVIIDVATRAGNDSFVIIEGDSVLQNDLGKNSGFKRFYEMFDDQESRDFGIHCFKFGVEDIVRSGLVQFIVEKELGLRKKKD
jgi:predicted ribonuclease YlaK